ncbi:hypothetical protein A1OO_17740 [Enterovibrio norvegicus FF-33]|uniref:hypothetical protein n=1 Tax=Enterovibrio norvegicus TaxID=188144 RepID=UPI0003120EED|nr:hypothetical protein [Enterovibrio norvegicus]OEE67586.1 hypothetical protein A1OO_17740 [Enterovibrio norvegicus FF-33]
MNISEKNTLSVFEVLGISLNKIAESHSKTPDFEAKLDGNRILVEVKEIRENPDEKEVLNRFNENNLVSMSVNLDGKRFQKALSEANRQLKGYSNAKDFCVVAIEDVREFAVRSESPIFELHQAMFGEYISWLGIDDRTICIDSHGKSRALSYRKNTSISCAVLVFGSKQLTEISAICIHNKFAKNPFPEGVFAKAGYREYKSELIEQREQLVEINS